MCRSRLDSKPRQEQFVQQIRDFFRAMDQDIGQVLLQVRRHCQQGSYHLCSRMILETSRRRNWRQGPESRVVLHHTNRFVWLPCPMMPSAEWVRPGAADKSQDPFCFCCAEDSSPCLVCSYEFFKHLAKG